MAEKMPQKRNQTSFTSVNQPTSRVGEQLGGRIPPKSPSKGRPKGRRNKRTVAQEAFESMGYNPAEAQVAIVQQILEMLEKGVDDEGNKITQTTRRQLIKEFATLNADLMAYQSSKASPEMEEYEIDNGEDTGPEAEQPRPLTAKELLTSRQLMDKKSDLNERFG